MKAAVFLQLLWTVSICGLTLVNRNRVEPYTEIRKTILDTVSNINSHMIASMEQLIEMQIFLGIAHQNASVTFQGKLTKELNNTRAAVDAAVAKGIDADYCYTDSVTKLNKIQNDVLYQFAVCANATLENFVNDLSVFGRIIQTGNTLVSKIRVTIAKCLSKLYRTNFCNTDWIARYKAEAEQFNEKFHLFPKYRKEVSRKVSNNHLLCLHKQLNEGVKKITEMELFDRTCVEGAE